MKFLKTVAQKVSKIRKRSGTGLGNGHTPFSSSGDGYQSFRTNQDFQGKKSKRGLVERIKLRLSSPGKAPATSYGSRGKREKKTGYGILRLVTLASILVSCVYFSKGYFKELLYGLKYFHIQKIEIQGCKVTTPPMIRERGGFTYGTSLFSIQPAVSAEKLKEHAWIGDAKIERKWPDRLLIRIKEFVPEAMVTQGKGGADSLYYVNRKGVCFSAVNPGEDVDFPVITGLDGIANSAERQAALKDALYFLKLAKKNNPNLPAQLVSEINLDETEGMVVYLVEHPFPIYFGRDNVKVKFRQLRRVLEVLYRKQKNKTKISQVKFIRMDYLTNKVLVAQNESG